MCSIGHEWSQCELWNKVLSSGHFVTWYTSGYLFSTPIACQAFFVSAHAKTASFSERAKRP
jgi:hypothetical protein